jgi:hypothetical protein
MDDKKIIINLPKVWRHFKGKFVCISGLASVDYSVNELSEEFGNSYFATRKKVQW